MCHLFQNAFFDLDKTWQNSFLGVGDKQPLCISNNFPKSQPNFVLEQEGVHIIFFPFIYFFKNYGQTLTKMWQELFLVAGNARFSQSYIWPSWWLKQRAPMTITIEIPLLQLQNSTVKKRLT